MKKVNICALLMALIIPLAVGALSAVLSAKGMTAYGSVNKPPLSPPAWAFPVAWTILYLLMGWSAYLVYMADADRDQKFVALAFFAFQLVLNFMWSIIFFSWGAYLFAFVWLVLLLAAVVMCTLRFFDISKLAACLMIPYIIWLCFAAYLNMGAYLLNRN